ncbi:hypothetical protein ACIRN4_06325 [Pimelobacter simplex]|uniref:hypothetical protein n=1 Tax=Nocardioides simplex TaxID=2045 RepID=UPI003814D950
MGNTASVDVWAPASDVISALTDASVGEMTMNRVGSVELPTDTGMWVVADVPEDGNAIVIADSLVDSNALARRAFDLLADRTSWRLELRDQDTGDLIADRPALATT